MGSGTAARLNDDQSGAKSLTKATATCAEVSVLLCMKPSKVTVWPARLPSSTCEYRFASMSFWPTGVPELQSYQ